MIPAPPRAVASAAHAWEIMREEVTLRQSIMSLVSTSNVKKTCLRSTMRHGKAGMLGTISRRASN